jgi:hypothetical protein
MECRRTSRKTNVRSIQLVKAKRPPLWVRQKYEVFEKEVEAWNITSLE